MNSFKTPKGTELPLIDLRGKDYLQVAHRLIWFREEHPEWGIETQIISHTEQKTLAYAVIKNAEGRILSGAHKQEDSKGFSDHLEKAETGAVGRALGLLGYGTQFAQELEEGERIVDAPHAARLISPPVASLGQNKPQVRPQVQPEKKTPIGHPVNAQANAQRKQVIEAIEACDKTKWTRDQVKAFISRVYKTDDPGALTTEQMTELLSTMESEPFQMAMDAFDLSAQQALGMGY